MESENANAPTPPVGVIESLSRGFDTVARHLGLALLPLLLDLLIWAGPRVSLRPALLNYYQEFWEPFISTFDEEIQDTFSEFSDVILIASQELPDQYIPLFGIPVLLAGREASALPFNYTPPVWQIARPEAVLLGNLALLFASFLLGVTGITLIAEVFKANRFSIKKILSRLPANFLWLGLFSIGLPILLLLIYLPFAFVGTGLALFSPPLGFLVDWVGRLITLWILLFFVFTIHGILINERNILGAAWDSVRVVQWNMTATMFFALIIAVLYMALRAIWQMAPTSSWLTPVAIAGNAFIVTGLVAASFVFFKDRYRYWHEMRAALLSEIERRRTKQS